LPEGEVVYLQPVSPAGVDDGFDDEEREALHQALDEGIVPARAGDHVDAESFTQELLTRKGRRGSRRLRARDSHPARKSASGNGVRRGSRKANIHA
jgi:hypothetical protein